ncbi:hypothetical protein ELQ35_03680 [Peribacillus cavernae]|uniref:Group-specific protein n=1 Tax=Peribacillus cavernae TaxID=1674310 RepID=A0A3S0U6X1_9BACI|nr:hypothetical protein [Peribacillus cavernae]MDQ0218460.1 hypothetical protein [Peribacillus cavernae]RUQ31459.1 hypothetical protein ELQ35_03680 [Peribacillus cavernae]
MTNFQEENRNLTHGLKTKRSMLQFIFPFMLENKKTKEFAHRLLDDNFVFFDLKNMEQEDAFYGGSQINHRTLEQYFLPNIEPILFPGSPRSIEGFRRFTKSMDLTAAFQSPHLTTDFTINSFDILFCPFNIGMMNIRVTLPEGLDYTDVLYFADTFRVMEPIVQEEENTKISCEKGSYTKVKDFIFSALAPIMKDFIDQQKADSSYFGSLPFFIDERMYVVSHISVPENSTITKTDLYRAGQLNGYDRDGKPFAGALNPDYIDRYYKKNVYDRWGDETYYVTSEYNFACVTKASGELEELLANQMYGQHYYGLLLFFYYKIVLLKLTHEHSKIDIDKDQSDTEQLIMMITVFSSKYLFPEVNSSTSGKEIFKIIKEVFEIDRLYEDVKKTLSSLYQNQDNMSANRNNYLLQILTIYTVVSGIYGMNLVIEDWKGKTRWSKIPDYSFFEYISLFVALSGILISSILGFVALRNWIKEHRNQKKKII